MFFGNGTLTIRRFDKVQETWACAAKGSRGRPQTFVCFHCPLVASAEAKFLRNAANPYRKSIKAPPHNSAARLAMSFPPSASCKFLDLPPVNHRNLHLHLTKNPFASRPPHLYGVTLIRGCSSKTLFFSFLLNFIPFLLKRSDEFINCHFLIDVVCDNACLIQVTNKLCIREAWNAIVHYFLA